MNFITKYHSTRTMTFDKTIILWQGWQAGNQTSEKEDWKFEVEEIRELLDASNGEDADLSSVPNQSEVE